MYYLLNKEGERDMTALSMIKQTARSYWDMMPNSETKTTAAIATALILAACAIECFSSDDSRPAEAPPRGVDVNTQTAGAADAHQETQTGGPETRDGEGQTGLTGDRIAQLEGEIVKWKECNSAIRKQAIGTISMLEGCLFEEKAKVSALQGEVDAYKALEERQMALIQSIAPDHVRSRSDT